jgi:uncharacterized protein
LLKVAISAVWVLLALYVVVLVGITIFQRRLLYFPPSEQIAPADVGLPQARVMTLKTSDGETLVAWYIAPASGKPLILYFHGNGGGLDLRNIRFQKLTETGNGLLAIEYRGYGASTGAPTESGLHLDGEAAYHEALALGVPADRLVVMGESLGTGVAVALAARHDVGALVLDSPYSSVEEVAASLYWMLPVRLLIRDRFRSDQKIAAVHAPVLIVHGSNDWVVPVRFGEKLFALANPPKRFIQVEGGGHLALGEAIPAVLAWIDKAIAKAP